MDSLSSSPFQLQIPPELLIEIFLHTLPEDPRPGRFISSTLNPFMSDAPLPHDNNAPVSLSRVCSYWRQVALSYSPLWSRVYIGTEYYQKNTLHKGILAMREFVNRSRQHPFTLTVSYMWKNKCRQLVPLMQEILEHKHRFVSLRVAVSEERARRIIPRIFSAVDQGMQQLQDLNIFVWQKGGYSRTHFQTHLDLNRYPQLKNLQLWNCGMYLRPANDSALLRNIRFLDLSYAIGVDSLLDILQSLSYIDSLRVSTITKAWSGLTPTKREIVLANLRCLAIFKFQESGTLLEENLPHSSIEFFHHIEAPALEQLNICRTLDRFTAQSLLDFIRKSSPPLKMLGVADCVGHLALQEILRCRASQQITDLYVFGELDCAAVLKTLTLVSNEDVKTDTRADDHEVRQVGGRQVFCPCLRSMTIQTSANFSPSILVDFLRSRALGHVLYEPKQMKQGIAVNLEHTEQAPIEVVALETIRIEQPAREFALGLADAFEKTLPGLFDIVDERYKESDLKDTPNPILIMTRKKARE